jgi:HAD hydrolase, family IA, variant 3
MKVALFDLDGVLIDTEGQYESFWRKIGQDFLPEQPSFAQDIKGMSLVQIYQTYFPGLEYLQSEMTCRLNAFEKEMHYPIFESVLPFLKRLQEMHVRCAVVTSSNKEKMKQVYADHPEFSSYFSKIFTAEHVQRSKPMPDCYLNAAKVLEVAPEKCVIFEDSINGLKAGRNSGAQVVALATSLSREILTNHENSKLYDMLVDSFRQIAPEALFAD